MLERGGPVPLCMPVGPLPGAADCRWSPVPPAPASSGTSTGSSTPKAFRRLKHKTQVFLEPEGDHYRTRMTHTIEVSRMPAPLPGACGSTRI